MKQVFNPYLPLWEYVPDGEPHVFGDRVYLYGSHDAFGGKKFCPNDYVCWSAPVTDLKDWRYEGVIYTKTQDPRMADGRHELWAPDVVRGKDGRYYLYYCPDDRIKSIGVAVCDSPAGRYAFYGLVKDAKGGVLGERPGDTIQFDPGVFIDDDGEIYLYSGNGPRTKKEIGREPKASVVMTLCDDMLTLKTEPKKLLPLLGESEGTGFEGHEFFEASSIRKIGGRYYLVYSSLTNHELCYAVSDRPDGGYRYGGVIVSNCDLFPGKEGKPLNCFGNNHGGLELQHLLPPGRRGSGHYPAQRQHPPGGADFLRPQRRPAQGGGELLRGHRLQPLRQADAHLLPSPGDDEPPSLHHPGRTGLFARKRRRASQILYRQRQGRPGGRLQIL